MSTTVVMRANDWCVSGKKRFGVKCPVGESVPRLILYAGAAPLTKQMPSFVGRFGSQSHTPRPAVMGAPDASDTIGKVAAQKNRSEPPVPALKVALQLSALRLPLRKALVAAARMGATGVELDARNDFRPQDLSETALRDLRRMLDDLSLKVSAVSFQTRRGYDSADELERRVTATKAAMKFASQVRAPVVVNQVGRVPEKSEGPAWDMLTQSLTDLSAYGMHTGALLAARTGSESGADLARLMQALPEGGTVVDLDPANLIINGFSPSEAVETLAAYIQHVHARDAARDLSRGRGVEVPLGRGTTDWPALLGALEDRQYRGFFTVARENADDPEYELGEAVKYLRNL